MRTYERWRAAPYIRRTYGRHAWLAELVRTPAPGFACRTAIDTYVPVDARESFGAGQSCAARVGLASAAPRGGLRFGPPGNGDGVRPSVVQPGASACPASACTCRSPKRATANQLLRSGSPDIGDSQVLTYLHPRGERNCSRAGRGVCAGQRLADQRKHCSASTG